MQDPAVLVVGAGPTGLTAAVELARRGAPVRVIDAKEAPSPLSRAVGVGAHSLELLEPSGVTERLLASGLKIQGGHLWRGGRELAAIDFRRLKHRFNFLLSLPQSETETILADVLAEHGGGVDWRTKLVDLEETDEGVRATLEGPDGSETAVYGAVFGADGVNSTVRGRLGLAFEGRTHKRIWSIADVAIPDWSYEPRTAQLFLHPGGDVGFIIPIGEDRFRAVSNADDAMTRVPGAYTVAHVFRADTFHIPARLTPTFQRGRVYLGGDAAHAHSPVGARGMNLGIEDAAAFARRFADGALAGYTQERRPIARRWIAISERVLAVAQSSSAIVVAGRDLALRTVSWLPAVQSALLRRVSGLAE